MKIIAVDYGDSRTGIAASDALEMLATPICVIHEKDRALCAERVAEKIGELGGELVVVGNPINMNGTRGPASEKCHDFAERLRERLPVPVEMWDERSTTVIAHERMNEINKRGKKRKEIIDAAAAAVILENYLRFRANQRNG
ncbi:MAG: Holliday junction resolvase RuvX [Bacteroides sp.]|nr:Holliday junction resolvase RuvX [Eubacterium sp.]MCM1417160.1 Holliday junction resolvase RuvX [Roseburia sp.]MCM1461219.1 Holliday junction resolvase RuvX [Bacteroides sp.]